MALQLIPKNFVDSLPTCSTLTAKATMNKHLGNKGNPPWPGLAYGPHFCMPLQKGAAFAFIG